MARSKKRDNNRTLGLLATLCALLVYFVYHMVSGNHGILAWVELEAQATQLNTEVTASELQVAAKEQRISRLRPEHLDPDLLDQQVRSHLGFTHPREFLIIKQK